MQPLSVKSKPDILRAKISDLAHRLGPEARLPRVLEMCREYNVAPNTLNQALREVEESGLITRRRGAGIFVTKQTASWVKTAPLAMICRPSLVQSSGHSPFWDLLMEKIQARASLSGAHFDCYFSREDNSQLPLSPAVIRAVEEHQIGGIFGVDLPNEAALWIMKQGVPVVNLFRAGHVTVYLDEAGIMRQTVHALLEKGCRRIALWVPIKLFESDAEAQEKLAARKDLVAQAFTKKERESLMAFNEENYPWLGSGIGTRAPHTRQGFEIAQRVFQRPRQDWPDGIAITDDMMTHGALVALRQLKVQVGTDVQISTHINKGAPLLIDEEALIRIEIDPEEIVAVVMERMENLLRQTADQLQNENEVIVIPARRRDTTKNPVTFSF